MPATFVVDGDNVKIHMESGNMPIEDGQQLVEYAALYNHHRGEGPTEVVDDVEQQIPFEELTNQQKLDIVFEAVKTLVVEQSRTAYVNEQQNAAKAAAQVYATENMEMPG